MKFLRFVNLFFIVIYLLNGLHIQISGLKSVILNGHLNLSGAWLGVDINGHQNGTCLNHSRLNSQHNWRGLYDQVMAP